MKHDNGSMSETDDFASYLLPSEPPRPPPCTRHTWAMECPPPPCPSAFRPPSSSHLHQAHVGHDSPAGDTGLAALVQHPGYAAQNTHHCKQECPGQGDLRGAGKGEGMERNECLMMNSARNNGVACECIHQQASFSLIDPVFFFRLLSTVTN